MGEVIKSFNDWMLEHPNWYTFFVGFFGWSFPPLWLIGWVYYYQVKKKRSIPVIPIRPSFSPPFTPVPLDYASLTLVALERSEQIKLKPALVKFEEGREEAYPETSLFRGKETLYSLQPGKGMDVLLLLVKVENRASRYMIPDSVPGYLKDSQGQEYHEEGEAVIAVSGTFKALSTKVWLQGRGWVKAILSTLATQNLIAPTESHDWVFIFHIPKERNPSEFSFRYVVQDTAEPFVGKYEYGYSSIPITGKGG
jgi:hypothetical protein